MNRNYFEKMTDGYFRKLDDGRMLFYPGGAIGRTGYVVDSAERERKLRVVMGRMIPGQMVGVFVLSIPAGFAGTYWFPESGLSVNQLAGLAVAALVLLAVVCWFGWMACCRHLTRGMEKAAIPNTAGIHFQRMGSTLNPKFVRFAKYYVIFFAVACLVVAVVQFNLFALLLGACMIPTAVIYWYMDRARTAPVEEDGDSTA